MTSSEKTKPKPTEDMRRAIAENNAIINNVGLVTRVWATLETSLFELFRILPRGSQDINALGVIFFTPTNMETRISFVDNLIFYRFGSKGAGKIAERLCAQWDSIKGKINALKSTRNAIVHGTVTSVAIESRTTSRLMPSFFDTLRFFPRFMNGQLPGLGSNELKNHEQAVWRVNDRVRKLTQAFQLALKLTAPRGRRAIARKLLEILNELESRTSGQNIQGQAQPDKGSRA